MGVDLGVVFGVGDDADNYTGVFRILLFLCLYFRFLPILESVERSINEGYISNSRAGIFFFFFVWVEHILWIFLE